MQSVIHSVTLTPFARFIPHSNRSKDMGHQRVASREQVPLRCAWAISIHKSQGQTMDFLEVDLNGCFEYGQAYVAFSRATSLEALFLRGFEARAIRSHKRVLSFYEELKQQQQQHFKQPNGSCSASSSSSYGGSGGGGSGAASGAVPAGQSSVVGSCKPLQDWNASKEGKVGWMTKKEGPRTKAEDAWMDLGPSKGAPTVTVSMMASSSSSSASSSTSPRQPRSERSTIWALPSSNSGGGARGSAGQSHGAHSAGQSSRSTPSTFTTYRSGFGVGAGTSSHPPRSSASSMPAPSGSRSGSSELSTSQRERIKQNRARALALRAVKGKKLPY